MGSINQFIIDGNVARDVALTRLPNGTAKAFYTVAVDNVWYEDGQRRQEINYIPITTYGRQAENDARFLGKGSAITAMGSIRSWYKAEEKRGGIKFEAHTIKFHTKQAKPQQRPPCAAPASPPTDDWLAQYDKAEEAGPCLQR